jgi:hypothetical protein
MNTTKITFIIFVVGVALSTLYRPAKIQDRFPMDTSGPVHDFCDVYYGWRETQAGGGVPAVDLLCFNAAEMKGPDRLQCACVAAASCPGAAVFLTRATKDAMAPRKRNKIDGQFNARLIEMMESPAYRVLSLSAHRVLDRISIELAHHGGNDNGRLPVTYDQFEEYGIHRHAVAPAILELEALGFVEVTQRGRASAGEHRLPNLFRLTCVNCKSTPNPTHEWRRVPDMETAEALSRIARAKKQNSSGGNRTENGQFPVRKPPLLS